MNNKITDWLPTTKKEMEFRNWNTPDVILFSGDAYVDHPSFGASVIGRILESAGYKVVIVPQPNWQDDLRDFKKFGKPRLFFGVTSGNMDSMMNHYTAQKRRRSDDAYTPGGKIGFRPDYATTVYSKIIKEIFPDVPVILGGIEASLRRTTHYDYWSDSLKPCILSESYADMLVYGMGEKSILQIASLLNSGVDIKNITKVNQTAFLCDQSSWINDEKHIILPSHEDCIKDKRIFSQFFKTIETQSNLICASPLLQKIGKKTLIINPHFETQEEKELDEFYSLPFTYLPHPKYSIKEAIPAYEMIKNSVTIHRGCFGGCSFCTISAHQGKFISSRSEKSILEEVEKVSKIQGFSGYISDLGGPSANMYRMKGNNKELCYKCSRPSCIFPNICKNLNTDHRPLISLYQKARKLTGIKKIFIGSGIRYDIFMQSSVNENKMYSHNEYFDELVKHHISGRLKVAPEHSSDNVLKIMRKPSYSLFVRFVNRFNQISYQSKLKQEVIPYIISGHPGCALSDMADVADTTRKAGFKLEQVQDFTPTPMTLASVMFYTCIDPYTMKPLYVAKKPTEKQEQLRFLFWYKKENKTLIFNSLKKIRK